MVGPPGSGKTMLARRLPSILPSLALEEALETTKLYSVAGMLQQDEALITRRAFRSPHHTISNAGLSTANAPRARKALPALLDLMTKHRLIGAGSVDDTHLTASAPLWLWEMKQNAQRGRFKGQEPAYVAELRAKQTTK